MRFIADKPHGKYVAQCCGNEFRLFADQKFEARCKVFVCCGSVRHETLSTGIIFCFRPLIYPVFFGSATRPM